MSSSKRSTLRLLHLLFAFVILIPVARSVVPICSYNRQCDDGNSATLDVCWPTGSTCINIPKVLGPNETAVVAPSTLSAIVDETNLNPLSLEEKRSIISAAVRILGQIGPNRFLQLNFLNVDIVGELSSYSQRLGTPEFANETNVEFHERMKGIFQMMDDLHSIYFASAPLGFSAGILGFRVQPFYIPGEINENGQPRARYAIADIVPGFASRNPGFEVGAEILKWDGEDISDVIDRFGENGYGSNPAAQRDRAVHALTFRLLALDTLPISEEVEIELRSKQGSTFVEKCKWLYVVSDVPTPEENTPEMSLRKIHFLRRLSSERETVKDDFTKSGSTFGLTEKSRIAQSTIQNRTIIKVSEEFQDHLAAEIIETKSGAVGRIILPAFGVPASANLSAELTRILRLMPSDGLILDARNNLGGFPSFPELLTKLVAGVEIEPLVGTFRATNLTLELANVRNSGSQTGVFRTIKPALETAFRAGERFTGPIFNFFGSLSTTVEDIDQSRVYFGPVTSVVNGRTYSSGDVFASLQIDYNATTLVGTSDNVGGGGASGTFYGFYVMGFPDKFLPLPGGVDFTSPLARFYRRGAFSGALVENFGIKPDIRYLSTLNDAMNEDFDLFEFLGKHLKEQSKALSR